MQYESTLGAIAPQRGVMRSLVTKQYTAAIPKIKKCDDLATIL
ncbi:hypothetical protein [Nostoc sp.]